MKKKISLLLVLSMVLSAFAGCLTGYAATNPDEVEQRFSYDDVGEDHWAYPWVTYMTERNYIHGYPAEENNGLYLYKPGQDITRAEFATILYFMLRPQGSMTETFSDVSFEDWFYYYIDGAVAAGYMSGCGDGTMRPNDYITREEASSIVYRAFKIEKYTEETDFADKNDISDWAYEAVMSLAEVGVVVGYTGEAEDTKYVSPKTNILRAEVASLLANADKFYPARVTFSEATVTYDKTTGGKVQFIAYAKNTSEQISFDIVADNNAKFTVSYTVDGNTATVSAEEFEQLTFTPEQLENLNITLNFPNVNGGDEVQITVDAIDRNDEPADDDEVVGNAVYDVTFGEKDSTTTPSTPGYDDYVTKRYEVSFWLPGEDEPTTSVRVRSGNKVDEEDIPKYDGDVEGGVYLWYDRNAEEMAIVNPAEVEITEDTDFEAIVDIDRVIIALNTYKAMKGQGTGVTTTDVFFFNMRQTTDGYVDGNDAHNNEHGLENNVWWITDVMEVIVTNDNNHVLDGEYTGVSIFNEDGSIKPLYRIYDDVARYVVDNNDDFATAEINSTTKHEYVKFFRAMVRTIDAAAENAAQAYDNARKNNGDKESAFAEFKQLAVLKTASSLVNALKEEGVDNDALADLAIGYVELLYAKINTELKTNLEAAYGDGSDYEGFKAAVAQYIGESYIYSKARG